MTAGTEPAPARNDTNDRNTLALVIFCAALGVLLMLRSGASDDLSARVAPLGYLLVLIAGWLALERVATRTSWVRWLALSTRVLLVVNMVLFAIVVTGLGGPQFVLVALLIVLLTFSAGVGIVGMIIALLAVGPGRSRPPIGPAAIAVVAAILTNAVIGSTPTSPTPTPTASSLATPTPSPTPTVTPTPTLTPPGVALRVAVSGKASGTVRSQPTGIACAPTCEARFPLETRVTLTPTAPQGSMFAGWAQACTGVRDCAVVARSDNSVTAFFETPARGFETEVSGESATVAIRPDQRAQVSVLFVNRGTTSWVSGPPTSEPLTSALPTEVALGACCPLGSASVLSAWRDGWPSDRVYARMPPNLAVAPGQMWNAFVVVRAPKAAAPGDYRFDGILTVARTGEPIAGGAFSFVVTVRP